MDTSITFTVNSKASSVMTEPERPLLDVLREDLGLFGTKYGCGEGQCGACTVLLDDRPVRSCVTPIRQVEGRSIRTIEGLAAADGLHPVQQAFADEGALQCGYCTSGMIIGAVALLERNPTPTDDQISRAMNGHICRCNGYPQIVEAIRLASRQMEGKKP